MKLSEALLRRAEQALTFDPREERRALLDRTAGAIADATALRRRIAEALGEGADAADAAIDRLLTGSDQLNVSYLERGMIAADAVARVEVRNGESQMIGSGTGFMISPRLFLTNHHVLPSADDAAQSWVHFRYEFDALGRTVEPCTFALDPATFFYTDADLDVTVVSVAPETPDRRQSVSRFGWLRISASEDTVLPGEWLTIIHHPDGRTKQVSLRQNLLVRHNDADLWYATETASGSSGAPVFNDSWQVVGVHRVGAPARDRNGRILTVDGAPWSDGGDESRIVWRAGSATRTSALVRRLAVDYVEHPLIAELLSEVDADACDAIVIPLGAGVAEATETTISAGAHAPRTSARSEGNGGSPHDSDAAGVATTVTVPLQIPVQPGNGASHESDAVAAY
jgi:endonuclease G